MKDFKNKVAVITGGASGIGLALACQAVQRGMQIVIADYEQKALDALATHPILSQYTDKIKTMHCDVSDSDAVERLAQYCWEHCGAVDVLFNNAGVSGGGSVATTRLQDWRWVININLMGAIYVLHHFLPAMLERNEQAHIVNTASIAGMVSVPDMAAYNISKHGVVTLSESLCSELRNSESKVKVSVLCPSFVKSKIHLAERNRNPEEAELSQTSIDQRVDDAKRVFDDFFKEAMTAEQLTELVYQAIEEERFYIFSHPKGSRRAVERRMQTILDDGTPYVKDASAFPVENPAN